MYQTEIVDVIEAFNPDFLGIQGSVIYKGYNRAQHLVPPNDIDFVAIRKKYDGNIEGYKRYREYDDSGQVFRKIGYDKRLSIDVFLIDEETFKKGVRKPHSISPQTARAIFATASYGLSVKGYDLFLKEFRKTFGENFRNEAFKIYLHLQGLKSFYDLTDVDWLLDLPPTTALKVLTIITYQIGKRMNDRRIERIHNALITKRFDRKEAIRKVLETFTERFKLSYMDI